MKNFVRTHGFLMLLVACTSSLSGVLAVHLETGERRMFPSESEVPEGWAACDADGTCPPPGECDELDASGCPMRDDCVVVVDPSGGADPAFVGCVPPGECVPESCGEVPPTLPIVCADGSAGGYTGRCLPARGGGCEWEFTDCDPSTCTDVSCGPPPEEMPGIGCADGSTPTYVCEHDPAGLCGWQLECGGAGECTPEECGPAPDCPALICADGSTGGCTDRCYRDASGRCGWERRECPPPICDPAIGCGPLPDELPICPDGTVAVPSCEVSADGTCGWQIRCGGEACTTEECGPLPAIERICEDGSPSTAVCDRSPATAMCGWHLECPGDPCSAVDCGPIPEVEFICPDGTSPIPICDTSSASGMCGWHHECPGGGGDGSRGCADGSGPACGPRLECCEGIPYPPDGICHASCPAISDRDQKTAFETVDPQSVLDRVVSMPISQWTYRIEPGSRHIGPMAQDFHQRFGLGADDRHIHPVDGVGVSLAAIQALNARLETLARQNETLRGENDALRTRLDRLERRSR
jgi:hypothetical protein